MSTSDNQYFGRELTRRLVDGPRSSAAITATVMLLYTDGTADVKMNGSQSKLHLPVASIELYRTLASMLAVNITPRVFVSDTMITDLAELAAATQNPVINTATPNNSQSVDYCWLYVGPTYTLIAPTTFIACRGYLTTPPVTYPLALAVYATVPSGTTFSIFTTNPSFAVGANILTPGTLNDQAIALPQESILALGVVSGSLASGTASGLTFQLFGIRS